MLGDALRDALDPRSQYLKPDAVRRQYDSERTGLIAGRAALGLRRSRRLPPAAAAPAQNSITIVREIDSDRYDPHKSTARGASEVMFMLADTLVSLDYDMKTIKPGLADSWTVSPDGKPTPSSCATT